MPMVETPTKSAKFLNLLVKAQLKSSVKLMPLKITVAEVRVKSNAIHARKYRQKIARQCEQKAPRLDGKKVETRNNKDEQCSRLAFGAWMRARQPIMRY